LFHGCLHARVTNELGECVKGYRFEPIGFESVVRMGTVSPSVRLLLDGAETTVKRYFFHPFVDGETVPLLTL
jgi:hypothetical protein